jgi:hypothetical protein
VKIMVPLWSIIDMTLCQGSVNIELWRSITDFKQKAWILINTDMADVIEYIHSNSPLSGEDLQDVNKLIRDHSLLRVRDLHR